MARKKKEPQKTAESTQIKYRIENYQYIGSAEIDSDTYKVEHRIVDSSKGKIVFPDFTPYCFMSKEDFEKYIRLGCPDRIVPYRPLSSDDLRKLSKVR